MWSLVHEFCLVLVVGSLWWSTHHKIHRLATVVEWMNERDVRNRARIYSGEPAQFTTYPDLPERMPADGSAYR